MVRTLPRSARLLTVSGAALIVGALIATPALAGAPTSAERLAAAFAAGVSPLPSGDWRTVDAIPGAAGLVWGDSVPDPTSPL